MRLDPEHVLSEPAIEALDALQWTGPESSTTEPRIPEEALMGLVWGNLTQEDRERVTRLALRSPSARKRLVELHREMTDLLQSPLERWDGPVRTAFYLDPACRLLESVRGLAASQWNSIASSNEPRFAATRSVLERISQNVRIALSAPRMAAVRGGLADAAPHLSAEVAADGSLEAIARPERQEPEGRSAILELVDPLGGRFPIAAAFLRDGRWTFRAEGFGPITGLTQGPLPNSLFEVAVEAEDPRTRESGSLWAEDEAGRLFAIDMTRPPSVFAGTLTLAIHVSPAMREAYGNQRLVVSIPLGRYEVMLGSWSVSEMADAAKLEANVFDLPEGDLPLGSILRARLIERKGA